MPIDSLWTGGHVASRNPTPEALVNLSRLSAVTTKELMARIGHSSPRAALIYQHATAERDRRIADAIDAEIAAAAAENSN
ncbi:MAG TPA: hypothetical protein VGH66_08915, partial [Acidimicrobiales bacterium]